MPHCSGDFLTEAAFPLRRRDGGTLSNIDVGAATEGVEELPKKSRGEFFEKRRKSVVLLAEIILGSK